MPEYNNDMSGIISKNAKKTEPNHADYTGECEVKGEKFWVNGWIKNRKDGTGTFLSLSFRPKQQSGTASSSPAQRKFQDEDDMGF